MAIISSVYVVWYPIRIALLIRGGNLKSKAYYKKFGGIWDEYKEDRYHTAAFEAIVCLKKLLIAMALVFLGEYPEAQITALIITLSAYYVVLSCFKPYKLENANIYFLKAELMFILGLLAVLYLSYKKMSMEPNLYTKLGWCVTYCFAFGWIRMIQIFFMKLKFHKSKKVKPESAKKGKGKDTKAKGKSNDFRTTEKDGNPVFNKVKVLK